MSEEMHPQYIFKWFGSLCYLLEKREIEKNDDCGFLLLQEEILHIFTEEKQVYVEKEH